MNPLRFLSAAVLTCLLVLGVGASTQEETLPSAAAVQAALDLLEESTDAAAAAERESYRKTLELLGRIKSARARAAKYGAEAAEAPALLASVRKELAKPTPPVQLEPLPDPTLDQLAAEVDRSEAALDAARTTAADLESTAAKRAARKGLIPTEVAQAQQALSAAEESLLATPGGSDAEARRGLLLAEVELRRAELEALSAERETYAARSELLPLRRDRAARDVAAAEKRAELWRERLKTFRQRDGESAASRADAQFTDVAARFPALEPLALANKELANLRSGQDSLPARLAAAEAAVAEDEALLLEIKSRRDSAARRSALGGLSESTGFTLRRDYEWIPSEAQLRTQAEELTRALSKAELEALERREQRAALSDTQAAARTFLAQRGIDGPEALAEAVSLLDAQRDSLDVVITELGALTDKLYEHVGLGSRVQEETEGYRSFIEQRILWVQSCRINLWQSALKAPGYASDILQSLSGGQLGKDLRREIRSRAWLCLLVLIAAGALVAGRRFLRGQRELMGKLTRSYRTDRYLFTVRALVQSLLLALPLPLLTWLVAKLLSASTVDLARAAGSALHETSFLLLTLLTLHVLLAEKGVGTVHFRWAAAKTAAVRRVLRWFTPIATVAAFVALTLDRQRIIEWSDTLGRFSFVIAMGSLAWALHRLLREESDLWGDGLEKGEGLLSQTHRWWSVVAVGIPIALVVLALSGYYYTALQLELRMRYSLALALALVLINGLLLRWLFIARRRLAVSQALEARAKRIKEQEGEDDPDEGAQAALEVEKVDIPSIDTQTRQLFRSSITLSAVLGLYLIWAAALPALQGLRRVQILPFPAIVATTPASEISALGNPERGYPARQDPRAPASSSSEKVTESEGAGPSVPIVPNTPVATAEKNELASGIPSSLTLADVVLAAILALLTSVAARNLPALLELALLQRLPLDSGARYAVTTLLRYLIIMIGVSAVSGALGIGWKDIQWLVAALTFGLAFGLQEIFANFISGIIILVERPVRVGDIVTVGTTEGRVTRLRMRATTILDWDRKEYLVPNKEFITGSVVNWTLSDPITRIIIGVGIAYGSDTAKARALLLKVAEENSLVVDDPEPSALFRRFGDSTLDFELRVFVENRDVWPQLIDQIHSEIDKAFRKAQIEIAFPQRDLHLRSGPARYFGDEGDGAAPPTMSGR